MGLWDWFCGSPAGLGSLVGFLVRMCGICGTGLVGLGLWEFSPTGFLVGMTNVCGFRVGECMTQHRISTVLVLPPSPAHRSRGRKSDEVATHNFPGTSSGYLRFLRTQSTAP